MNTVLVLAISMVVALLTSVEAQTPSCSTLRSELARKRVRIFENAEGTQDIVSEVCVDFQAFM